MTIADTRPFAIRLFVLLLLVLCGYPAAAIAASIDTGGSAAGAHIDLSVMGMSLFGGLALFLYGMEQMASGLKAVAGDRMKDVLARLTSNRFMGVATGAFVTAVIQSSSVTTVLVVGFITAGLLSFAQSIGIIMGANIGTTITAQIIAFKVTKIALLIIAVGFSALFFAKNERIKQYGAITMGLGLVFFGMNVMSDGMSPLRSYQPFLNFMTQMENPLLGILVAAVFTALVQSSSATTGIIIVMAGQGLITLPAGIALIFGTNIGTCVTALLATIGKPREALRAAVVHVLFNVAGVLLWLGFIPYLAELVILVSPAHTELTGADRLGAEVPRQIANAHSMFNIANTFIFIWLTGQLARMVEWLVPDRPLEEEFIARPKYLDDELLATPSLALDRVRLEIEHMGETVRQMLGRIMPAILSGDRLALRNVARLDDRVDSLYAAIVEYLGKISKQSLNDAQMDEFLRLMNAANELENIGDTIETNLVVLGNERIEQRVAISLPTQEVLKGFHHAVSKAAETAIAAVAHNDEEMAQSVIDMKREIDKLADSAALHQAQRLVAEEPNRIPAYTIEMDIIEKLKRIYYFSKRMAKTVLAQQKTEESEAA